MHFEDEFAATYRWDEDSHKTYAIMMHIFAAHKDILSNTLLNCIMIACVQLNAHILCFRCISAFLLSRVCSFLYFLVVAG